MAATTLYASREALTVDGVVGNTHRYRGARARTPVHRHPGPVILHDWINNIHRLNGLPYPFYQMVNFNRDSQILAWAEGPDGTPVLKLLSIDQAVLHAIDPATGEKLGYRALAGFTNSLLWNRDLSNGVWSVSANITQDAVGLDGVSNTAWTVTDDDDTSKSVIEEQINVTNDTNTHAASWYIKKDNDETRVPAVEMQMAGGTLLRYIATVNTKTGGFTSLGDLSDSDIAVEDAGDWWQIIIAAPNNGTGNTSLEYRILPAYDTSLGGGGSGDNSATGSIVYDFGGVYLNYP